MKFPWPILLILALLSCAKSRPMKSPAGETCQTRGDCYVKPDNKVWKYKATVVNTSVGSPLFTGVSTPLKIGRFGFTQDRMNFYDAYALYKGGNGEKERAPRIILSIPVKHSQYKRAKSQGVPTNTWEEDNGIPWHKKSKMVVNWADLMVDDFKVNSKCASLTDTELLTKSVDFSPEYISFTLRKRYSIENNQCKSFGEKVLAQHFAGEMDSFVIDVMYSFAPYTPNSKFKTLQYGKGAQGYNNPLRRKFGFFESTPTAFNQEKGKIEVYVRANRWDPNKTHTIYYTDDLSPNLRWIYTHPTMGVMAKTNKVMKEAGIKMRFNIKSAKAHGLKFGDVRYSFIHAVNTPEGGPLGYGPSDADPLTGEILRSVTVLWTSSLPHYIRSIRSQAFDVTGEEKLDRDFPLYSQMGGKQNFVQGTAFDSDDSRILKKYLKTKMINNLSAASEGHSPFLSHLKEDQENLENNFPDYFSRWLRPQEQLLLDEMEKQKKNKAQKIFDFSEKDEFKHTIYEMKDELSNLDVLISKGLSDRDIIDTFFYRVAIHEFGHNLSLRHNFWGSIDHEHFHGSQSFKDRDGATLLDSTGEAIHHTGGTSSVMDYLALTDEFIGVKDFEAYDKAALRYLYGFEHTQNKNTVLRENYLFCTDEHRISETPYCEMFDFGTTPYDIVKNAIEKYRLGFYRRNNRLDRSFWSEFDYVNALGRTFKASVEPLKFYSQFSLDGEYISGQQSNEYQKISDNALEGAGLSVQFLSALISLEGGMTESNTIFNDFSGEIEKMGLFYDKFLALKKLLGKTYLSSGIGFGRYISFWGLLKESDSTVKSVVETALKSHAPLNPKLGVAGYQDMARLFSFQSFGTRENRDTILLERFQMHCFSSGALKKVFPGINLGEFKNFALKKKSELSPNSNFPSYSNVEDIQGRFAIAKVDGDFYVAHESMNDLAFSFLKSMAVQNTVSEEYSLTRKNKISILDHKYFSDLRMYEQKRGCLRAEDILGADVF